MNEGLPFPYDSADYIICMEVMEHLENATFFLEEVERVLNEKGKLILSVPNPYCWLEILHNMRKCKDTVKFITSRSDSLQLSAWKSAFCYCIYRDLVI